MPPLINQVLCDLSGDSIPVFDFAELSETAELARYAYKDSVRIAADYSEKYHVEVLALPKSAGQVILLKDSSARMQRIGIRGTVTSEYKSVLTDAQYTKKKDPKLNIYVHTGFQKAVSELYQVISAKLDTSYATQITGHSLGGALAVLLTYYLTEDGYKLQQTVTFGQPKVTNKEGVTKYSEVNLLRVVNDKDPVAYIPPLSFAAALKSPYQHGGGALLLKETPDYKYICSEASGITFVTEFWTDMLGKKEGIKGSLMENVKDHRDKHYINKLRALAQASDSSVTAEEAGPETSPDNPAGTAPADTTRIPEGTGKDP